MNAPDNPFAPDNLIFISIASYRDSQLIPTIADCIAKARHPDRLRFGICWQHGDDEAALPYLDDLRFCILDIDYRDSKGACWARAEIMKLWQGEAWFFQVDSHCRFAEAWDDKLLVAVQTTGSEKPILSTYAAPFTPGGDEALIGEPQQMAFQSFLSDGIPQMKPVSIPGWQTRTSPVRARFLSAGFLFAPGSFVREVPYDPLLYFIGEESSMTLRAFTSGYDLFHPCENIVWHDYLRVSVSRHWDDHTGEKVPRQWTELDAKSREKTQRLLLGEPVESFGLGRVRTLRQYEEYAGISFHLRKVQDYTRRYEEAPNPPAPSDWTDHIYSWLVRIVVDTAALPAGALDDPNFWYVAVHDEHESEIYRRDFPRAELKTLTGDETKITLICELESGIVPAGWTVWPVDRSKGWLYKVQGTLVEEDYTIVLEDKAEEPGESIR